MEKLAIDTNADSVYTNNSLLTDNLEFFEPFEELNSNFLILERHSRTKYNVNIILQYPHAISIITNHKEKRRKGTGLSGWGLGRKIDIVALQEMRWTGKRIMNKKEYSLYYSYTTEEEKEAFYDPLGKLYDDCFRNDIKFLLEDMNAKIGKDSAYHSFRLLDVSVNRNVNLDNDHFLLVARLKARTSHTRNQKRIRSVRYNTCMLKKEKRKKIYESKADEIPVFPLDLSEVLEEMKGLMKNNEAYNLMIQKKRDARNEEKRIHRAKKRKSMMTQMEPIQKYSTKHLSREIFRTMNDNRRAFISRTKNFISKMDEIINQVDKDNVFDELDDTDSYKDIRPSNEEVHKASDMERRENSCLFDSQNGNTLNCENYRGKSLLNTTYKVLSRNIFIRLLFMREHHRRIPIRLPER
ncbi:hypothetical protein CWI38_1582p0010 [Hamiltosporidium tvaerminnensis]|uniref:Endonuclease/exonuclease/phosphatase domain-containing protein n=1 Tax=Hamiltosporidium tvaerminnensis TaxID=1176355 RepID=A0A4Q9LQJ0_9MICR|nr:hypothetical protein CWI38_1582p0010 [Hamiltosporidium tvaerminnensis]